MFIYAIAFLVFIVLLVIMIKSSSRIIGYFVGRMISDKHRTAEEIITTEKVPRAWISYSSSEKSTKVKILKRLEDLIKYFNNTPCFDSNDTKEMLLSDMKKIYSLWEESELKDIVISSDSSKRKSTY